MPHQLPGLHARETLADRDHVVPARHWLRAGEVGRALLYEGEDALDEVLGLALLALSVGLGLELLGEPGIHPAVEQTLRACVRGGGPLGEQLQDELLADYNMQPDFHSHKMLVDMFTAASRLPAALGRSAGSSVLPSVTS